MQATSRPASSASTKLVHGGAPPSAVKSFNLEEYRMVKNALHERRYMLANAPHRPTPRTSGTGVFLARAAYYLAGTRCKARWRER
jgi:glycerol-3-phosphate dehydrogenase